MKTVDWADPKFEARVEVTSVAAAALRDEAEKLVDTYFANAELSFEDANPHVVSAFNVKPDAIETFDNALHDGYSDLNKDEIQIARAIDATHLTWARNPVNGGYSIPILEKGDSRRFFPDFLVWCDDKIVAIDPKGGFLLQTDAGRKLLAIRDERARQRVLVRFITNGRWSHETMKQTAADGFSVWWMNSSGQIRSTHHGIVDEAVAKCLDI